MKRRDLVLALIVFIFSSTAIFAVSKTYKYKCPKCNLIQEYSTPGIKKCPNDKRTMTRI